MCVITNSQSASCNAFCPTECLHSLVHLHVLPDGCYMQDTFWCILYHALPLKLRSMSLCFYITFWAYRTQWCVWLHCDLFIQRGKPFLLGGRCFKSLPCSQRVVVPAAPSQLSLWYGLLSREVSNQCNDAIVSDHCLRHIFFCSFIPSHV